jgi:hypothetical protein
MLVAHQQSGTRYTGVELTSSKLLVLSEMLCSIPAAPPDGCCAMVAVLCLQAPIDGLAVLHKLQEVECL